VQAGAVVVAELLGVLTASAAVTGILSGTKAPAKKLAKAR
jgi:hypothetical protein